MPRAPALLALVALAACSDERPRAVGPSSDARPAHDAAILDDAQHPDAESLDAGPAEARDATNIEDAAASPDAFVPDASNTDAAFLDSSVADASFADSGQPDAGRRPLAFDVPEEWTALPQTFALIEDITGDGRRDAVEIDGYNPVGQINIRFAVQDAAGHFTPMTGFSTPGHPGVRLAYADFNADRRLDVFVRLASSSMPNVYVALGDGGGNFGAAQPLAISGDVFADFNGDGRADVLQPHEGLDSFLYLSDANGMFQTTRIPVRGRSLYTGDFDGDGTLDLVSGVRVHRGLGGGQFGAALAPTCTSCSNVDRGIVARIDSDGRDDLVIYQGPVTVLLGQPDGSLREVSSFSVVRPQVFTAGDIDGDGHTDLIAITQPIPISSNDGLELFFGDGTGAFQTSVLYQNTKGGSSPPIVLDANRDGRNDVLLNGRWIAAGMGRELRAPVLSTYQSSARGQLVDYDHDANLDFVTIGRSGDLSIFEFGPDHRLGSRTMCQSPARTEYQALGDITGDGIADVRSISSGTLSVWVGQGPCTFGSVQETMGGMYMAQFLRINRDTLDDLVFASNRQVGITVATAPGTFASPALSSIANDPAHLVPGDFTSDGLLDVVVIDNDSNLTLLRGDAMRQLTAVQTLMPPRPEALWYPKAADIDADGDLDVLAASGSDLVLFDNTQGQLTRRTLGQVHSVVEITVADLDADGRLEIIAADNQITTSIWSVAPGGQAVRQLQLHLPRGAFPYDVDGDGDVDLVYRDGYDAQALVTVINNRTFP